MNYEAIVAYSNIVIAFGVVLIGIQAIVALRSLAELKKHLAADHKRSRIEKAIELLDGYTKGLDKAMPAARTLVNKLSESDCEKLRDKIPLKVPSDKRRLIDNMLQGVLSENPPQEKDGYILLNENHTAHIFFLCMSHLNSLEVIFQAWVSGVADHEIIERQFSYLIMPSKRNDLLRNFRKVVGGIDIYPAINTFVEHVEAEFTNRKKANIQESIA